MFSTGVTALVSVDSLKVVDSFDVDSLVVVVSVEAVSFAFVFVLALVTGVDSCVVAPPCEAPQPTSSDVPRTDPRRAASTEG